MQQFSSYLTASNRSACRGALSFIDQYSDHWYRPTHLNFKVCPACHDAGTKACPCARGLQAHDAAHFKLEQQRTGMMH